MNSIIRELRPGEKKELTRVMRTCFGWFGSLFFDLGDMAYVYELDGAIAGGITISSFRIDGTRRGGVVKWVFTLPEARGHGAASLLIDRAMEWFTEQGCTHTFACVEGYNTGSSNRFSGLGFRIFSFGEQLRSFGMRLPQVWLKTFHVVDLGHFLWTRVQGESDSEVTGEGNSQAATPPGRAGAGFGQLGAVAATLLLHTLFMYLLPVRQGTGLAPDYLWSVPAALGLMFGLRFGAMWAAAAALRLRLQYRAWETGLLIVAVVSTLFGGIFFAPGGLYPDRSTYRYSELLPKLGPIACSGAAVLLALGWALWAARASGTALGDSALAALMLNYIRVLLVFEVLIPFFPMASFNGRRVLDWNRYLWALLAIGAAALLLF
ncbi:MAG: GNAT family N-acetyltransferase [Spirochaetaceae bacterium]|nr:MAG: GNAT family N-acetyltransferase [Spirochaetaceae bacterium]